MEFRQKKIDTILGSVFGLDSWRVFQFASWWLLDARDFMRLQRSTLRVNRPSTSILFTAHRPNEHVLLFEARRHHSGSVWPSDFDWPKKRHYYQLPIQIQVEPILQSVHQEGARISAVSLQYLANWNVVLLCKNCSLQNRLDAVFAAALCTESATTPWLAAVQLTPRTLMRKIFGRARRRFGRLCPANLQLRHHLFDGELCNSTVLVGRHRGEAVTLGCWPLEGCAAESCPSFTQLSINRWNCAHKSVLPRSRQPPSGCPPSQSAARDDRRATHKRRRPSQGHSENRRRTRWHPIATKTWSFGSRSDAIPGASDTSVSTRCAFIEEVPTPVTHDLLLRLGEARQELF